MTKVIGVKFRCSGKLYYFDPTNVSFKRGEKVIVETVRGTEMGNVVMENREVGEDSLAQPLKPIIRKATYNDIKKSKEFREKEPEASKLFKEAIAKHNLEMKLVETEYTFDGSKLIFYFTADGRVDFRELVKDLASIFRTRIELRQIGVRDEAMICGGIGVCGRELCCKSYLNDFAAVSIKMAKEQNLSLNPTKISGVCGRLMCCLKNEADTYEFLNNQLPNVGEEVIDKFEGTKGTVKEVNILKQRIKVVFKKDDESFEEKEYDVSELNFERKEKKFDDEIEDEALAAIIKEDVTDDDREEQQTSQQAGKHKSNHHNNNQNNNDDNADNNNHKNNRNNRFRKNRKNRNHNHQQQKQ